jgi:hypothetical protein
MAHRPAPHVQNRFNPYAGEFPEKSDVNHLKN